MTTPAVQCPLCQQKRAEQVWQGIREDPERPVYRCTYCEHGFIENRLGNLRDYYRETYRLRHSNVLGQPQTAREQFDLMRPLIPLQVELFRRTVPRGASVLEVGCSSGYFLDAIRQEYTVFGNEWDPERAAFVRDELGIPCSEDSLEEAFPGQKFTAICGFQLLEHIPDPIAWLKLVKSRLIGGGWVYFEVPNADDALISVYDIPEFRRFFYRDCHLNYFSMQSLANALAIVGYEARVTQRQRYSFYNHLQWMMTGKPQPNVTEATSSIALSPDHPAHYFLNEFFARVDRDYRQRLDKLKVGDTLIAVGVKREI